MGLVYLLRNEINKKCYIGQTIKWRLEKRWGPKLKNSPNDHLRSAIRKYGAENFSRTILAAAIDQSELDRSERFWIAHYGSCCPVRGYNMTHGGRQTPLHTPEVRERMKEAWRHVPKSRRAPHKGIKKGSESQEHRNKIAEGVRMSWERRKLGLPPKKPVMGTKDQQREEIACNAKQTGFTPALKSRRQPLQRGVIYRMPNPRTRQRFIELSRNAVDAVQAAYDNLEGGRTIDESKRMLREVVKELDLISLEYKGYCIW